MQVKGGERIWTLGGKRNTNSILNYFIGTSHLCIRINIFFILFTITSNFVYLRSFINLYRYIIGLFLPIQRFPVVNKENILVFFVLGLPIL